MRTSNRLFTVFAGIVLGGLVVADQKLGQAQGDTVPATPMSLALALPGLALAVVKGADKLVQALRA